MKSKGVEAEKMIKKMFIIIQMRNDGGLDQAGNMKIVKSGEILDLLWGYI